jgi:hypothetical protein
MNGDEVITIDLNTPFNDPGVDANDNEDGDINVTSDVSPSNPNVNKIGTYYIHYSVSDAAGNKSTTRRTVVVRNAAESMAGAYRVTGTCNSGFTDGIIVSTNTNNRVTFTQFGRHTNAAGKLTADLDLITLNISLVPATFVCGTNPVNRTFSGYGAISFDHDTLWINSVETTSSSSDTCTYIYVRQ